MIDLSFLNENQRKAVEWEGGPLLVLAGPGSGKTLVLTLRVAKLIHDLPSERFRVLGLTFTRKAAHEMRKRVEGLVVDGIERTLLTTFHSFSAEVLRQHGNHVGLAPDFAILTQEADREEVLADAIREISSQESGLTNDDIRLLPLIDKLLSNCITDDHVMDITANKEFGRKLSILFAEYKRQLMTNNRLDYSAILYFCDHLFTIKPRIAKQMQIIYPFVCVDEFQDTNLAQYKILRAIVDKERVKLFVVADDDQIIYQWNGANPERLKALREDYGMSVIQLPENYRCPSPVIKLANNLIDYNINRSPGKQPLKSVKQAYPDDCIRVKEFPSLEEELEWIAQDIGKRPTTLRSECVLLARTTKLLECVANKLSSYGIPAHLTVRKNEFESIPMRWLHAMLRLANARHDREQLRRICKSFYSLEGLDIRVEDVVTESALYGGDFIRTWCDIVLRRKELEHYTKLFIELTIDTLVDKMDFVPFISNGFIWIAEVEKRIGGIDTHIFSDYADEKQMWQNLQENIISIFGREDISLHLLLQEMDLSPKAPPPPPGSVQCLTIHAAKGTEFKHVYLFGLVEDQLPSFQSKKKGDDSREMQEERRNCFVAITRCQETLTLTYAREYFGWSKEPSRFLSEMGVLDG
uniref:DNA 3'-5' helicase n=1 Tax=Desulfobacca acetoxidans TaxID=60893 RepID=A0A7V4LDZ6_9BACT